MNVRMRVVSLCGFLAAVVAMAGSTTYAQNLYWDTNSTTAGAGSNATATWNGTNSLWNSDATGGAGGSFTATTANTNDLFFVAGPSATSGNANYTVTLSGTRVANSLNFQASGNTTLSGGTSLTLGNGTSGAGGITIAQFAYGATPQGAVTISTPITLANSQTWTNNATSLLTVQTGALTNGGYLLTIGGTGNTTISSAISGTGGLTKSDAGLLTLSSASNAFSGQLTVASGTLSIASINNASANGVLGNSALPVILGSSGNTGTLSYTAATGTTTKRFTFAAGGTGALDITTALTINGGILDGSGNLTKTGAGTLTITAPTVNNYNQGSANQFSGTTQINVGKISLTQLGGAGSATTWAVALWKSAYDTTGTAGAGVGIDLATASTTLALGGLGGNVDISSAVESNWGTTPNLVLNPQAGVSVSYGGVISNGASGMTLQKIGTGTQSLTNANTYNGSTTVGAGTLALSGNGTILNSAVVGRGGVLSLDNSLGWTNRVSDSAAITLGSLTLTSSNGAGNQTETVGATTFNVGGKVIINNGATVGDQTTLALGNATRSAGAAIDFVGTGGTLGGGANSPNVTSSSLPANTNGILPWATVGGTQWAENNSNSVRAYSGSFFAINSSTNVQNAQVSGNSSLSGARVANSLNLISTGSGQSLSLGANTLTLGSAAASPGAILKSGTDSYTISGTGQVRAGSAGAGTELIAHVDGGDLIISAPLNTAIVNIAKGGTGNLTLSGTRAATLSGNVSIAGGVLEFQGATTTVSGVISGSGGLTINLNAGQVFTASNNSNSYTGPTVVKGGALKVDFNANGLPGGTMTIPGYSNTSLAGSNLVLNGGVMVSTYGFGRTLGAGPDQVQVLGGTSGFSVSGGGGFGIDNGSELVWGSTYFQPSVFVLNDSNAAAVMTVSNGIDLKGADRTINVNSTFANSVTISGLIRNSTGTAGFTKTGVGQLILSNASSGWNGNTSISGGMLDFAGNTLAGVGGGSGRNITVASGAAVRFNAASNALLNRLVETSSEIGIMTGTTANNLDFSSSTGGNFSSAFLGNWSSIGAKAEYSGTLTPASDNYRLGATGSSGLLGIVGTNKLTGTQGLLVGGTGASSVRVELAAAMNFTGDTVINSGAKLTIGNNLALQNSVLNLGSAGGTFALSDGTNAGRITGDTASPSPTFGGLSGNRSLFSAFTSSAGNNETLLANTAVTGFTLNVGANKTVTFAGAIGGFGTGASGGVGGVSTLTKTGLGTQVLSGNNTYVGTTTITGGTLQVDGLLAAGSTVAIGTAGTLSGTGTINGNATLTGSGVINKSSGTIAGTLGVTGGNWNGAGSVTGLVTSSSGTFTIGSGANLTANGDLNVTGGSIAAADGTSTITGSVNYTSGANSTFAGIIAGSGKTLTLNNSAATLTLTGNSTYTGATTITAGTLVVTGSLASSGVTNNTALIFDSNSAQSYANNIGGSGSLTKQGTGLLVLTGTNSYAGPTAVDGGTLAINGDNSGATGALTIANLATLGGSGTIGGATTILGAHTPGNSPGIQTFASDLTYSGGNSTVSWELWNNTTTNAPNPNAIYDQINVSGNLSFAGATTLSLLFNTGNSTVNWANTFWDTNQSWTLYDVVGTTSSFGNFTISGNASTWLDSTSTALSTARSGSTFTVSQSGNDVLINYVAVPEPAAIALLGSAVALLGVRLARRRQG